MIGTTNSGAGASRGFVSVAVTFPTGSECLVTGKSKNRIIKAKSDGFYLFNLPYADEWDFMIKNSTDEQHKVITFVDSDAGKRIEIKLDYRVPGAIYQEVEYLQSPSTNGAYIDTGFIFRPASLGVIVECDCEWTANENKNRTIFGDRSNQMCLTCIINTNGNGNIYIRQGNYGNWTGSPMQVSPASVNTNTKFHIKHCALINQVLLELDKQVFWNVNGTFFTSTFATNHGLTLFAEKVNMQGALDANEYGTNLRIYNFKIRDKDGNLLHDFVPCYRKIDSVAGMVDIVDPTRKFYTNSGTGTFIVGADVI